MARERCGVRRVGLGSRWASHSRGRPQRFGAALALTTAWSAIPLPTLDRPVKFPRDLAAFVNALDTMRGLAQKSEVHAFKVSDIIFKADDPETPMFGVLEGSVRLSWKNDEEMRDMSSSAGNVFGAGALVWMVTVAWTAQAESPYRLIEMNREKFLFAVQEAPMFAVELLASVDARLRDLITSVS